MVNFCASVFPKTFVLKSSQFIVKFLHEMHVKREVHLSFKHHKLHKKLIHISSTTFVVIQYSKALQGEFEILSMFSHNSSSLLI